ncbi:SAV_2336 N-terminal domain-related protein [Streptomyces asiaticus]|uniref:SAV_2336 N-terminal domain-related protein n=1 Tax=Streptomyces asiaticus TaxID=114695 RepID=UPI002484C25F|nr:SAV_2336 N-terminal domain-related protein [Streptomyces asiaticus]
MIERLRRILDGVGYDVGATELLDVLWLARAMKAGHDLGDGTHTAAPPPAAPHTAADADLVGLPPASPRPACPSETAAGPHATGGREVFGTGSAESASGTPARAVRVPGPRALPGMHSLAGAIRPLRGHSDHPYRVVTDIEATVRQTAESGVLDVVPRPLQELRYTAVLLVDDSPSMRVWRATAREVKRLLERSGVFRNVRVRRFTPGGREPSVAAPHSDRSVVFVFSDGVHAAWRNAAIGTVIAAWARTGPVVALSPLPRRMWRGTGLATEPYLLTAARPFPGNGDVVARDPLSHVPVEPVGPPALPVVTLSASSLATWARFVAAPGVPRLIETAWPGQSSDERGRWGNEEPADGASAEQLIRRFRSSFSPEAYQLAVRLSAIRPLNVPLMQLVRAAALPASTPAHVAELLLGGLVMPSEEESEERSEEEAEERRQWQPPVSRLLWAEESSYEFKPGVRELLSAGLSTEQCIDLAETVGRALEPYVGRLPAFAALIADPHGQSTISEGTSAFAMLVGPVLERLYHVQEPATTPETAPPMVRSAPPAEPRAETVTPYAPVAPLRFTILGPQLAWRGSTAADAGPSRQRAVLAALLLRTGRVVTAAELIDGVWGDEPPMSAPRTLRGYIAQLRELLAPDVFVSHEFEGYRLRNPTGDPVELDLDLTTVEQLESEASRARQAGDLTAERDHLADALSHFSGEPLAGVPGPFAEGQRAQFMEWRLNLQERLFAVELERGRHTDVLEELGVLSADHPLRERLRALLMLALHHSGRPAEALAVYDETRRMLNEDLGIDPGPELVAAHRFVLGQGDTPRFSAPPAQQSGPTPRTLLAWRETKGWHFTVLGPVRAQHDGRKRSVGSPQQRAVLAALLLYEDRSVTAAELIDGLWGAEPPDAAHAAIRTYASRLRKALQDFPTSDTEGYTIRLKPHELDLTVARELAEEARAAEAVDNLPHAIALLGRALDMWDGEPLAGVPGPYAAAQRIRLQEWRLELLEQRLSLELEVGRHAEAVPELIALTAEHPLRERLCELLMLALYRSGRQAEALAVYAHFRLLLADELGVDPGPDLAELQQRILQADERLAGPIHAATAAVPPPTTLGPGDMAEAGTSPGSGQDRRRPWRFRMSDDISGTPTVAGNLLYVTSFEVHALDVATGRRQFKTRNVAWAMAVADGRIHASDGPTLYALDAEDGAERWRLSTDGWVYSLKVDRGTVVTGTRGGGVQAWEAANGELLWEMQGLQTDFETPESGPAVHDGTVYVRADARLRALEARTGAERWSYPVGDAASCGGVPLRLLAAPDGVVYVSAGTRVLALDIARGDVRWRFEAPAVFLCAPAYAPGPAVTGGGIYIADCLGTVYAIDAANGRDRWRIATEARQSIEPVLVADGSVHLGSGTALYTLDAVTGTPKWRFRAGGEVIGSPVVADGRVHFGSADSCLYTVDAAGGQLRWKLATGGEITGSPVAAGGVVYACSKDRCVYALDAAKGTAQSPPARRQVAGTGSPDGLRGTR